MSEKQQKMAVILNALTNGSLNRFEAERLGDHCLNSTVSALRKQGHEVLDKWEKVPNRVGSMTRVKRYWAIKNGSPEASRELDK